MCPGHIPDPVQKEALSLQVSVVSITSEAEEWRAGWSLLCDFCHMIIAADGSVWLYVQLYFVTVYTDANKLTYTNINICKHTYMYTCALLAL